MKKFDNFESSLNNLKTINDYNPPYSPTVLSGIINLFEITFELSWKTLQEILRQNGYLDQKSGSARAIIKEAYSAGIITDESAWLKLLETRNLLTHVYDGNYSLEVAETIKREYIPIFDSLATELKSHWL